MCPYLVTVRSFSQPQHALKGLGHNWLPFVQKLPLLVTEVKAKAKVQFPGPVGVQE